LLIIGGLVAASCFSGAALYLMSMFNQTQYSKSKNNAAVEDLVERIATKAPRQ
jgi:hypothetical protein